MVLIFSKDTLTQIISIYFHLILYTASTILRQIMQ